MSYSTEEHIVGKWIDGKAVYEKTVYMGSVNNSGGVTLQHDIASLNIDKIISITGFAYTPTQFRNIPHGYLGQEHVNGYADNHTLYIASQGYAVGECYLTIKYTKK